VVPAPESSGARKWLAIVLVLVAVAGAALYVRYRQAAKPVALQLPTAKAVRGVLRNTVRLAGSIIATRYVDIVAPRLQAPDNGRGMVLVYLPDSGSEVKKGEVVARIDGTSVKDHLVDVEAQVSQGNLDLQRVKAYQDATMEWMRQRARAARGAFEKAQQEIRALPAKTSIDQELLKLSLSEAQATAEERERQVDLAMESQAAGMRVAELNQEGNVRHLNRHKVDWARLTITTPMAGTVIMRPINRHGEQFQTQIGDVVTPGQPFMRVVETGSMRMDATMNQAESELVRIGQRARIRFDAYPDIELDGTVVAVGTIATGGRRVNYFVRRVPVRIAIDGQDPRVLPDLTASADVVLAESDDDSLIVPRQAVQDEDGKSVVYVRQAGLFTAREVETGLASNTEIAVKGLQAGDEVALQRPY